MTIIMKKFGNYIHSILLYQIRHTKYINRYHSSNIFINISIISVSKFGPYKKVMSKLNYNQTQISI